MLPDPDIDDGSQDLRAGLNLDGKVAAQGIYEFLNAPTRLGFDPVTHGHRSVHAAHVRLEGLALAVDTASSMNWRY
ncbi:hypothetical protein ACJEIK_01315 [Mycobacterium sp. SMC-16]|uniref:hypothetical protein n=1 Tax=Mycobacteriaceae TaxID=1762 RepID=UPI0013A58634